MKKILFITAAIFFILGSCSKQSSAEQNVTTVINDFAQNKEVQIQKDEKPVFELPLNDENLNKYHLPKESLNKNIKLTTLFNVNSFDNFSIDEAIKYKNEDFPNSDMKTYRELLPDYFADSTIIYPLYINSFFVGIFFEDYANTLCAFLPCDFAVDKDNLLTSVEEIQQYLGEYELKNNLFEIILYKKDIKISAGNTAYVLYEQGYDDFYFLGKLTSGYNVYYNSSFIAVIDNASNIIYQTELPNLQEYKFSVRLSSNDCIYILYEADKTKGTEPIAALYKINDYLLSIGTPKYDSVPLFAEAMDDAKVLGYYSPDTGFVFKEIDGLLPVCINNENWYEVLTIDGVTGYFKGANIIGGTNVNKW